jgi:predicted ATPase
VLDNCEHVLNEAAGLADTIMRRCPHVCVIATSREPLRIRGEHVVRVPPLALGTDAERLFMVRARAAAPDARLDDEELVSRVCRRLDGLPLAIELAAARLASLSLIDVSARLDDRFRLLAAGHRLDAPRHHTLEAVVAWSYGLLGEADRHLFDRCAVFIDDFSLHAAEVVTSASPLSAEAILDGLGRLVDKSLLTPTVDRDGRTRYRMLETLRHYGLRTLHLTGSLRNVEARLVTWALEWVDRLEQHMRTPEQDAALCDADPELANLRRAMELALSEGDDLAVLRIVSAAPVGPLGERRSLIARLVGKAVDAPDVVAQAYLTSCNLAFEQGNWAAALEDSREAARRFNERGDPRLAAWARFIEALSSWGAGELDVADRVLGDVLEVFRAVSDDFGLAYALWAASQREGDLVLADRMAAESEGLLRAFGASIALAHDLI